MDLAALTLVLASAFLHSGWNLLAKRSRDQVPFLWLAIIAGLVAFAPAALYFLFTQPPSGSGLIFIAASAVIHVFYFLFLGGALARTDLSVAYPLARGTGPLFVLIIALIFLGESPSGPGIAGVLLVVIGIYLLNTTHLALQALSQAFRALISTPGTRYALLTGLTIGIYSVVDKAGVDRVNPLLYMWLWVLGTALLMAPFYLRNPARVTSILRYEVRPVIAAGVLLFGAYTMVLTAMTWSIVTYVSAARETSILIATLYGALLLKESVGPARILGAIVLALGVALIAIAG
jgi:drug/metabolite transporter (DMT)-like permease